VRTEVRVARGPYRGRVGTIAGELGRQNRYCTKAIVFFENGAIAHLRIVDLEPAAPAHAQLELPLAG